MSDEDSNCLQHLLYGYNGTSSGNSSTVIGLAKSHVLFYATNPMALERQPHTYFWSQFFFPNFFHHLSCSWLFSGLLAIDCYNFCPQLAPEVAKASGHLE